MDSTIILCVYTAIGNNQTHKVYGFRLLKHYNYSGRANN